jgi:glutamate--cysteine ligase
LRHSVPKEALKATVPGGGTVRELAANVLAIASDGLTRRARLNSAGDNEGGFLDPLHDVVASGMTPADRLLDKYYNEWNGDVSRIYKEFSF